MKIQFVRSNPAKVFVAQYKTKSGQTKNRYKSVPFTNVRTIKHLN